MRSIVIAAVTVLGLAAPAHAEFTVAGNIGAVLTSGSQSNYYCDDYSNCQLGYRKDLSGQQLLGDLFFTRTDAKPNVSFSFSDPLSVGFSFSDPSPRAYLQLLKDSENNSFIIIFNDVRAISDFQNPYKLDEMQVSLKLIADLDDAGQPTSWKGSLFSRHYTSWDYTSGISRMDTNYAFSLTNFSDVSISGEGNAAIPEPATWAAMLAGFGLMGAAIRRQTARTPVARA